MGRKVLSAVVCWLTLCEALGEAEKTVNSSVVRDNESAESAPRPMLYPNIYQGLAPMRVYASGAPYAAYSFQVPRVLAAPAQLSPASAGLLRNLKDSYGMLAESPQTTPYRTAFPQQYVKLQDLPPHLAQPLVSAAAPSFQFKTTPNYFFGPHSYKVPQLQLSASPATVTHFGSHAQPLVYAGNIKNFAPSNSHSSLHKFYAAPQQSNGHYVHFSNGPVQHLQQKPAPRAVTSFVASGKGQQQQQQQQQAAASQDEKEQKASQAQTSITTIVNGKKTVVTLETQPPIPLLDLNLLEPLTFEDPVVPQVQHFLPTIAPATLHQLSQVNHGEVHPKEIVVTYHKPKHNHDEVNDDPKEIVVTYHNPKHNHDEVKVNPKEIVVTKTTSYDSGYVQNKPRNDATIRKQNKPQPHSPPAHPTVVVRGNPDGEEITYEIDTPNGKETGYEQVISYNKETKKPSVEVSYDERTNKEPKVYSYTSSSKDPLKVTKVDYDSHRDDKPKHVVYTLSSAEQEEEEKDELRGPQLQESEDSSESSAESDEEGPAPLVHHEEPPRHHQHSHSHTEHHGPRHPAQHSSYGGSPQSHHHSEHHSESPRHSPNSHYDGNSHSHDDGSSHPKEHTYYHESRQTHPDQHYNHHESEQVSQPKLHPTQFHAHHESPTHEEQHHHEHDGQHYEQPRHSQYLKAEHRSQEYKQKPNQKESAEVIHTTPSFQPITLEYEEDLRILPTHKPHANIKVDPNQHTRLGPVAPTHNSYYKPSPAPQKARPQQEEHPAALHPHPYSPRERVVEKSKRVIIKEDEETPEEMHKLTEQLRAEMMSREENGEEDFEKAYKESAYGFPAYEENKEETEKDIYNPASYGVPRYHNEYNIEKSPYKQYQQEDDKQYQREDGKFPKYSRLTYKDGRDDKQEDYFLDYSAHKPDAVADLYKSKVDYLKLYKKNRPEKSPFSEDGRNDKKPEKIILAPSFDYFTTAPKPKAKFGKLFARYKAAPIKYEYDYSNGHKPRDNTPYASRPVYKHSKTQFVEPQFQYGFEPLVAPIVIDSELAAMASNDSPESEKPGTRKKLYKENWYIKKTRTAGGKPS